jgi:hypothetical protein
VIKQEMYLLYESGDNKRKSIPFFRINQVHINIPQKLLFIQLLRTKGARQILRSILLCIVGGLCIYRFLDFKLVGLSVYLGAYTLNMLQYTIYLNSNYFDTLATKPFSIHSLLLNAFYTHLCVSSVLFVLLFIYTGIYDNQYILPVLSIYAYISGPMALILLFNILFAQKHEFDSVESDITISRTFEQKIIGIIAGGSLFGVLAVIHFSSTIGCNIIIAISFIVIITHHYWISKLNIQFTKRKYQIMKNLRN